MNIDEKVLARADYECIDCTHEGFVTMRKLEKLEDFCNDGLICEECGSEDLLITKVVDIDGEEVEIKYKRDEVDFIKEDEIDEMRVKHMSSTDRKKSAKKRKKVAFKKKMAKKSKKQKSCSAGMTYSLKDKRCTKIDKKFSKKMKKVAKHRKSY